MQLVRDFWIYTLTDCQGNVMAAVVNETSDNICLHGYDAAGNYQQYDSYEAYHTSGWATKHGFKIDSKRQTVTIEIDVDAGKITDISQ